MPTLLCDLPFELLYLVIKQLDLNDLSTTRLVSKKLRYMCDRPELWRNIQLKPQDFGAPLWNVSKLRSILSPHKDCLEKVAIWDVRDDIVKYLLLECTQLQELSVYGWTTLSDHAFLLPKQICLRRLRLIGGRKTNFASLDSLTFSKFIQNSPWLEDLSIVSCHIHLHAGRLIDTLRQNKHPIKYLNIATKQTWSTEHISKLFELCSNLSILGLVPDSNAMTPDSRVPVFDARESWSILRKNYKFIEEEELVEFSNIILFRH